MGGQKRWCFTLHTDDDCAGFREDIMDYMICGRETCPTTGRKHIQGFVVFKKRVKLSGLKKIWRSAHAEAIKGSIEQNRTYCSKEGCFHEHGSVPSEQGKRTDLLAIKQIIDDDDTYRSRLQRVREQHYGSYLRYGHSIERDLQRSVQDRSQPTKLHILVGPTGCGKSSFVQNNCSSLFWKTRGDWWDGYEQQRDCVFDDFYGWISIDQFLRVADRYPLRVPVKGGFVQFTSEALWVTSNLHYREWWKCADERVIQALERRITTFREWSEEDQGFRVRNGFGTLLVPSTH